MSPCPYCQDAVCEPNQRFCPNCGGDLEAPPLAPLPGAPDFVGDAPVGRTSAPVPWDVRGEVGFFTALVDTTQRVLLSPVQFFSQMPVAGGLGSPLLYALVIGYLSLTVASVYDLVFLTVAGPRLGQEFDRLVAFSGGTRGVVLGLILGPALIVVQAFVLAGIYHLALLLVGGAQRGFEATFRVTAYAGAAGLLALVPLCGRPLLQPVLYLVLIGIGFAQAHHIGGGRAVAAVLLPLLLLCCCCLGLGLAFWGSAAALLQRLQ